MPGLLIGYARGSTDGQDLTAQRTALADLGVEARRIYVDHGMTGTNRDRRGLREAMAACRHGDTLVVTKLDRLARSLPERRWLRFAAAMDAQRLRAMVAVFLRLRDQTQAVMGLFADRWHTSSPTPVRIAQGPAHVATIVLLLDRATGHRPHRHSSVARHEARATS